MPGGEGSGTRARSTDGDAVPATVEHPAEPIHPAAAATPAPKSGPSGRKKRK